MFLSYLQGRWEWYNSHRWVGVGVRGLLRTVRILACCCQKKGKLGKMQTEVPSQAVPITFLPLDCAGVTCDKPSCRNLSTLRLGALLNSSHSHLVLFCYFVLRQEDKYWCSLQDKLLSGTSTCLMGMVGVG